MFFPFRSTSRKHWHSIYSSATPCRHLWCQWSQQ